MKLATLFFSILLFANLAHADSIWLTGAKADAVVQPLILAGVQPLAPKEHDFFQAGYVSCAKLFDKKGDYFPNGKVRDYVGEGCLIYGDIADSDGDDGVRREVLIPKDDRELTHSPEIKARLENNRAVRESLEGIIIPMLDDKDDGSTYAIREIRPSAVSHATAGTRMANAFVRCLFCQSARLGRTDFHSSAFGFHVSHPLRQRPAWPNSGAIYMKSKDSN